MCRAWWFPTLIACSPNLPRVYIKLCKHGNHFTFLQSRENLFLILCEGLRRLNCGKVTNDQSNYCFNASWLQFTKDSFIIKLMVWKTTKLQSVFVLLIREKQFER